MVWIQADTEDTSGESPTDMIRHYHPVHLGWKEVERNWFRSNEFLALEEEECIEPLDPETWPIRLLFPRTEILLNITLADHRRLCSTLCESLGEGFHIGLEPDWPFPDCFRLGG